MVVESILSFVEVESAISINQGEDLKYKSCQ